MKNYTEANFSLVGKMHPTMKNKDVYSIRLTTHTMLIFILKKLFAFYFQILCCLIMTNNLI